MESTFRVWDDGFSPIVFAVLNEGYNKVAAKDISSAILTQARKLAKKYGRSFVLVNFSSLEFSHNNIELMKQIKSGLIHSFISGGAFISLRDKKFDINFTNEDAPTNFKCFDCFEQALGFINNQIENSQLDLMSA